MTDIGIKPFNNFYVTQDKTKVVNQNKILEINNFNERIKEKDNFYLQNKNGNAIQRLDILLERSKSYIDKNTSKLNQDAIKKIPGTYWLGFMESNGNREVGIIIPDGTDLNKPFEVIFYLHGLNYPEYGTGTLNGAIMHKNYGFSEEVKKLAKNKNIILVIPQGPSITPNDNNKAYTWFDNSKNGGNFMNFKNKVEKNIKEIAPSIKIESFTIKAHSAGGYAVRNASQYGYLKDISKIDFLDASYKNWAEETYNNYIKDNPNGKLNLIYIPNTYTQTGACKLQNKKNVNIIKANNDNHFTIPKNFISF